MFNKSTIMKRAWGIYRENMAFVTYANAACKRLYFKDALQQAWSEAKNPPVRNTQSDAKQALEMQIIALENKDYLGWERLEHLGRLRAEYARAA